MRMRWMATAAVVVAALTTPAAQIVAQEAPLAGHWALDAERSQNALEAVAAARGGAGGAMVRRGDGSGGGAVMMRGGGAGSSFMAMIQDVQRLRIEVNAEHVTLHMDDAAPVAAPLDGSAASASRWGVQVQVRASLSGDTLTVETTTPDNMVVKEVMTATGDGELVAELHMPLPRMSAQGQGQQQSVTVRRVYTAVR